LINKEHKFFDRYLKNNLDDLKIFLEKRENEMRNGMFLGMTEEDLSYARSTTCFATALSTKYNIFQLHNINIYNLYIAIKEMTAEACEYYNIDFKEQKYMIEGWFNFDDEGDYNPNSLHDHLGGHGIPCFHGYYCVNAEPSVTHYQINREKIFENLNKNNRAILSETGHPHVKGSWNSSEKRITIAYDILPLRFLPEEDISQHWIPLF